MTVTSAACKASAAALRCGAADGGSVADRAGPIVRSPPGLDDGTLASARLPTPGDVERDARAPARRLRAKSATGCARIQLDRRRHLWILCRLC